MSAWIVGNNLPGCLPDGEVSVHLTREDALIVLRADADQFASDVDEVLDGLSEDHQDEYSPTEAHVGAIFAVDGEIPAQGPAIFILTDANGWARVFFMSESEEDYYEADGEAVTAEAALKWWIEGAEVPEETLELLTENTWRDASAAMNLAALEAAATYHGIDLDALNDPLPRRI